MEGIGWYWGFGIMGTMFVGNGSLCVVRTIGDGIVCTRV